LDKSLQVKARRGAGILDIKAQNKALLLKFADKFYNNCGTPWVQLTWQALYSKPIAPHAKCLVGSFWWQDVMTLSLVFRSFASCEVGNGRTVCFWEDIWNGRLLKLDFPQLHSFARDPKVSVKAFMSRASEDNLPLLWGMIPGIRRTRHGPYRQRWLSPQDQGMRRMALFDVHRKATRRYCNTK